MTLSPRRSPLKLAPAQPSGPLRVAVASPADRERIYQIRHEVYAEELHQHATREARRLWDPIDEVNEYLIVWSGCEIAGFLSITPPGVGRYAIEKYLTRDQVPFPWDDRLFEVRLLTVRKPWRGQPVATLLFYAALRWVEAHGGTRIMAIGRGEIVPLYQRLGLGLVGKRIESGAVTFEVMEATVSVLRERAEAMGDLIRRLGAGIAWGLSMPFEKPAPCFHGGAFFERIGEKFDQLERRHGVINADVLDAWFPPSPRVTAALSEHLDWLVRTSPPTSCEGLVEAIAQARGVAPDCILPGAGSSDLIYLALRHWVKPDSRVLLLDPTYGEYAHVLERVIGCPVDRLTLKRENHYRVDPEELVVRMAAGYDLVVLVNPNSPTGQHISGATLRGWLQSVPKQTRVWVDETYVDFVGRGESLESYAMRSENLVVCKSMSKAYALSGARSAYLCAGPHQLEELRSLTPPWAVGLLGQVAAVKALEDPGYYQARYADTHRLRGELADGLRAMGIEVVPGCANFLLGHLPESGPSAEAVVAACRQHGVFIRDAGKMGRQLGTHAVRFAVKAGDTQRRLLEVLSEAVSGP